MRKTWLTALMCAASLVTTAGISTVQAAENFPSRPITMVVPYGAGVD